MTVSFKQANTLIIDDYPGMRTMLSDFVRNMGVVAVSTASNGKDALSQLNTGKFEIVICDYHLGSGANGQHVLEEAKLRELVGVSTIWVMVTAEKTPDMVMGVAEVRPDDYILKPINQVQLQTRLEKLIARKKSLGVVEVAMRARDFGAAVAHCDQLLKTQTVNPQEVLRVKSNLLLTLGGYEAARTLFESVLAQRDVAWARCGLGRVLFYTQDYQGAAALFGRVLADNQMYIEAADWLARSFEAMGDVAQAQKVLQQAVNLSPNSPPRQKQLGDTAVRNGALDVAQAAFKKNIRLSEFSVYKNPAVYARLAQVLADKGEGQEALNVLKRSKADFRFNPVAALQTAAAESAVYQKLGQPALAQAAMANAEQLLEELAGKLSSEILVDVAKSHLKLGQKDKACRLFAEVVKNNHEDTQISSQIAAVFADEHMAEMGQALVQAARQEVIDINNQGVMLARQGNFEQGLKLLRSAVQQLPSSEAMIVNLCGMLLAQMSKNGYNEALAAETRDMLDRLRALNPANKKYYSYAMMLVRLQRT